MIHIGVNLLTDVSIKGTLTKEQVAELIKMIMVCEGSTKSGLKKESAHIYNGILVKAPDCSLAVCREVLVLDIRNKEVIPLVDENRRIEKFLFEILKTLLTSDTSLDIIESDLRSSIDYQLT